jgi:peptidoglycan hydrolase-like protein with peptidoglycan-binding domain
MSLWLAKDQRSNEVVALQNALNLALQRPKALVLDGIFGPLTDASVREFQKCQGITADGIAGPHTLEALFAGFDVTVKVWLAAAGAFAGTRTAAAARTPPVDSRASGRPQPEPAPPMSFGTMCVLHREAIVRGWVRQDTPKGMLDLPPLSRRNLVIDRLALPQRQRFSLNWERPHEKKEVDGETYADVEVALEPGAKVSKEAKEVELEFSYRVLINRFKPWLVPSLSLLPSTHEGYWQARAELSLTPFKIFEKEWKRWTFEMSPLLRATVTLPAFFGRNRASEMNFSAGLNTEISRGVGRRGTRIFLGAMMGILGTLEFDGHRIGGRFKRPEGGFGLAIGTRWDVPSPR